MWIRKSIGKHGECLKTSKNVFPPKRGRECINKGESRKGNLERGIPKEEESIQKNELVWQGKQTEWQTSEIKKWEAYSLGLLSVCPQCQPCHNCKWLRVVTQIIQDIQVCLDMSGYRKKIFSDTRMWRDDWSQHISTTLPVILRRSNALEVIEVVHMKATTNKTLPRVVRCQKIRVILVSAGNVWATYTRLMAYRPPFCGVAPWHRTGTLWCFSESRPKICRRPFLGSAGSSWCPKCEFCDWDQELIVGSS